ncbi:hypothetical protein Tco_1013596 [Tanacetum coccineum]
MTRSTVKKLEEPLEDPERELHRRRKAASHQKWNESLAIARRNLFNDETSNYYPRPSIPTKLSLTNNAGTGIEGENSNEGEAPTTQRPEDLESPTLYHPSISSSVPFPSRLKNQKKDDKDERLLEPIKPLEWKALGNRLKLSIKEPPQLELKELHDHLEYTFLQEVD